MYRNNFFFFKFFSSPMATGSSWLRTRGSSSRSGCGSYFGRRDRRRLDVPVDAVILLGFDHRRKDSLWECIAHTVGRYSRFAHFIRIVAIKAQLPSNRYAFITTRRKKLHNICRMQVISVYVLCLHFCHAAADAEFHPGWLLTATPLCSQGVPDILGTKRRKKRARSFGSRCLKGFQRKATEESSRFLQITVCESQIYIPACGKTREHYRINCVF